MGYKRRIILINRDFQFRFSFYVCSWLITVCLAYPFIISSLSDYLIMSLVHEAFGPQVASILETREALLWILIIMQITFVGVVFLISIFMSHRIAGPLHKLKKFFREASEGNIGQVLAFRKSDYFQEV